MRTMLVETLLAPMIALLAAPSPGAFECDRLVAVGALAEAEATCTAAGVPGSIARLLAIRTADGADRTTAAGLTATLQALDDAALARAEGPERIIEEALFQHFARVVRAMTPLDQRPELAQWPLPGLPVPRPILPALEDESLDVLGAAIERSDERIREVEGRLAGVDPRFRNLPLSARQGLEKALDGLRNERRRLLEQRRDGLEGQVNKTKRPKPAHLLHLADTYFALDAGETTVKAQRRRGRRVLRTLRRYYATDGAAGIAALWLAGFALDDGDPDRARPLLDEAGPFDPGLSTFFEALLQWRLGQPDDALARLRVIKGPLSPALTAQVAALEGLLAHETGDSSGAAEAWMRAAENAPAEQATRARLEAALAWSMALAGGASAGQVPAALRRHVLLHAVSRGRMAQARGLFAQIEKGRDAALPYLGLMLVDSDRAAGRGADADRVLSRLVQTYAGSGPWRSANLGAVADDARLELLRRVERRVARIVGTGVPVAPAGRETVAALVEARIELFEMNDRARLKLCEALGELGFLEQVESHLVRLKTDASDPLLRRAAAQALVVAYVQRAREEGAAGAATGPWLLGRPIARPVPESVTRLVEAQSELIGYLALGSADRDALVVERATVRLGLGDTDGIATELAGVAERHPDTALGLRAIYQLMRARPDQVARIAERWSRRNAGPPARNRALRKALQAALGDAADDVAGDLMSDGAYVEAAERYARAAKAGDERAPAMAFASAIAWTSALRPGKADRAWQRFTETYPDHPQAALAHLLRGRMLQTRGLLKAAADAFIASAGLKGPDAARALMRAFALLPGDFGRLETALGQFVRDFPEHPARERFEMAQKALADDGAPSAPTAGAPPAAPIDPGLCRGEACLSARFWP